TDRATGILLGRTTYQMFEPAWSTRTVEDDPGAPFFNDTTKYVVSGTLTDPTWRNSELVGAYDADAIRGLKEQRDGAPPRKLTLTSSESYDNGAVYLAYEPQT